ncbi:MAG: hypothetical protein DMD87_10295 [Candidatus Rokuibacteriota bacterium]|nr:MAG: hypothetical protein DMD87_10295 [Candidatus Rokubacteria bacterium]
MARRTVPTMTAIPSERFSKGGCRSAHRPHLSTALEPTPKKKSRRTRSRPHESQRPVGAGSTAPILTVSGLSGPGVDRGIPEEPPYEAPGDQPRQRPTSRRSLVTGLRFGQAAPGFSLPSSAGGETSLADFKGKDVVLVFYCYDWGGI